MRYQQNYTPKQAAYSIATEALNAAIRQADRYFAEDSESYRKRVHQQMEKLFQKLSDSAGFL